MNKIVKFCIFEKHGGVCEKYNSYCHLGACPYEDLKEFVPVKAAAAVDAVEVVRCWECAIPHNKYTGCPKLNGLVTPSDFYCPYGERRTDATD